MHKYTLLLIAALGLITGCSKQSPSDMSGQLYTHSLGQIKKALKGSWDLRSVCNTTIAGTDCQDITNESLIFSDTDSLFLIEDNKIIKKDKIQFIKIKSPDGYKTDYLYVFKFPKDQTTYFPYDIKHDSLIIRDVYNAIDAGFQMTLTKSK